MSYGCEPLSDDYVTEPLDIPPAVATPPNSSSILSLSGRGSGPSPVSLHSGPDWNGDFQEQLREVLEAEHNSELSVEKSVQLRQLCSRFADTASALAIKIIEELHLPVSRRTILPMSDAIGGVAGGEKYIHSGIFFKLSRDWKGIYGGDGNAMKAAEHEIKGGMAYLDCRIVKLRLPLMALIRYRGHCILAESIIPVGNDSLVYGSRDGGVTIFAENQELNEKMRLAAKHLNLKAHRVWNRTRTKNALLHAPIDLEGHIGRDGLFYDIFVPLLDSLFIQGDISHRITMIDTARVFPPVAPVEGSRRGAYLYKLFRPEFVRLNPVPLSSDAYSRFGKDSELEHNEEVLDATVRLEGQVIPEFARYLDMRYADARLDTMKDALGDTEAAGFEEDVLADSLLRNPHRQLEELGNLVAEMHLRGINLRYALAIHSLLSSTLISRLILTEVVARSAKHLLDDLWRGVDSVLPDVYLRETAVFFSTMFSIDSDAQEFWNSVLAAEVDERFKPALRRVKTAEMSLSVDGPSPATSLTSNPLTPTTSLTVDPSTSLSTNSSATSTTTATTNEPAPPGSSLRRSNPRNQIRSTASGNLSAGNSLNSDTSLNAVDGELLRRGIDPTLLLFRICQLGGIELDFAAWDLPAPPKMTESIAALQSRASKAQLANSDSEGLRQSQSSSNAADAEESGSVEGSHEDSLATLWLKVEHFLSYPSRSGSLRSMQVGAALASSPVATSSSPSSISHLLSSNSNTTLKREFPVHAVKRILARTKYLNRISYEEATALTRLAQSKSGQEAYDLLSRANRKFQECLEIKPDDSRALLNWAFALTKQAEIAKDVQKNSSIAITHWRDAFSKYERALVLRPTDWRALNAWATALSSQAARVTVAKEGISLYRAAIDKFDRALKLLPLPHFHTLYNTGNARLKLARLLLDDLRSSRTVKNEKSVVTHRECSDLLSVGISRFQESLEIEGTNVDAMTNLAIALATQARICVQDYSIAPSLSINERDRLYQAAYLVYQRAIHLVPTSIPIYYGWGNALFRHALARREGPNPDDRIALTTIFDAASKYQAALVISEKEEAFFSRDVFINFGNVLMLGAKLCFRLQLPFPNSFLSCCNCYLNMAEQPQLTESESSVISQVLTAFKRYLPKEATGSVGADAAGSTCKPRPDTTLTARATSLLLSMGEQDQDEAGGNALSGSGGNSNYEQAARAPAFGPPVVHESSSRRSPPISPVMTPPSPSPSSGDSPSTPDSSPHHHHHGSGSGHHHKKKKIKTSSGSPSLTKRKSNKSLDSPSSSPVSTHHSSEAKESKEQGSSLKKSTPKLDLSGKPQRAESAPLSPTSAIAEASPTSDSIAAAMSKSRPGSTTSKLKQRLGSLFGIRSKTPSTTPTSPTVPTSIITPTSPPMSPKLDAAPVSPNIKTSGGDFSAHNALTLSGAVVNSNSSGASTMSSGSPAKTRSKKRPARSLSYAEESRPRTGSAGTASSNTVTTSSSGGRDTGEMQEAISNPGMQGTYQQQQQQQQVQLQIPMQKHHYQQQQLLQPPTSPGGSSISPTRSRRKSDADSHVPLRRQSTANISSPRTKTSTLTQSSPLIARGKNPSPRPPSPSPSSGVYEAVPLSPHGEGGADGQQHMQQAHAQVQQLQVQQQQIQQHLMPSPPSPGRDPSSSASSSSTATMQSPQSSGYIAGSAADSDYILPRNTKSTVGSLVSLSASSGGIKYDERDRIEKDKGEKEERKTKRKSISTSGGSKKSKVAPTPASASSSSSSSHHTKSNSIGGSGASPMAAKRKSKTSSSERHSASITPSSNAASSSSIARKGAPPTSSSSASSSAPLPLTIDWNKTVLFSDGGERDIKEAEFLVRGVLGSSRSGLVFLAKRNDIDYAMKVRLPEVLTRFPKVTPIFDHPFFTRLKCFFFAESKLIMAFNLVRGPQLLEYISRNVTKKVEGPRLDHLVFNLVAAQLVCAFSYLSDEVKIPYRDFKPGNILINDTGNIVLTTHCEEDQSTIGFTRADVSFLAPEIVIKIRERRALATALGGGTLKAMPLTDDAPNRVEDDRASWWSLGMYLLVIATGVNPFSAEDPTKVEENVLRKRLVIPQNLGKLSALLNGLLDRDLTSRLCSSEQVRKHPYFHNMDWDKLVSLGYHPPFLPNIQNMSKKNLLSDSRSLTSSKASMSLNSSSLDTSLDLSSTAGQIALMNTMVMPDVGNQLEGNTMFIQNTSMIEDQLCASSSASSDGESD